MSPSNDPLMASVHRAVLEDGGVPGEFRVGGVPSIPVDVELMIIGEAPGPEEARQKRPFVGKAGQLFQSMADEAGLGSFYITNICKEFPGYTPQHKIAKPHKEAVQRWEKVLALELSAVRPKKILLLGQYACKFAFPGQWAMKDIVGTKVEKDGALCYAAYHPASFLYNQGTAQNTRNMNLQRRILRDVVGEQEVGYDYEVLPPNERPGEVLFLDVETDGSSDVRTAYITEWSLLEADGSRATLCFDRSLRPPRPTTAVFHNALFDYPILARHDPQWLGVTDIHDTMVMAYVMGQEDLSLKGLSNQLFGIKVFDYKNREECGKETYNAQDVFLTRRLYETLLPRLEGTAYETDRALIPILTYASLFSGYEIDRKRLSQAIAEAEAERQTVEDVFHGLFPGVNMASPAQLLHVLPVQDTQAATLRELDSAEAHLVLRWRELNKDLTTYLYPFRDREKLSGLYRLTLASGEHDEESGGTRTGRLSSHSPNMQNLDPIVQRCLRAPAKHELVRVDYDQIELRCAAEISQDPYLLSALRDEKRDLHQETATLLGFDRAAGKRWNFAVLYGAEEYRLSQITGRSQEWCADALARFREVWAGFYAWAGRHWSRVAATGFSESPSPFRHRRKIHLFDPKEARKQAVNHPIQCHAVYITKAAMAELGYVPGTLEFVNQVHDEVHYIVPKGEKETIKHIKDVMLAVGNTYLPQVGIGVSVKTGRYWE